VNNDVYIANEVHDCWKFSSTQQGALAILQSLAIPLWAKRAPQETHLFFSEPKLFSKVLVVLSEKIIEEDSLSQQVFQGMLKVLNLSSDEISIAWFTQKIENLSIKTLEALRYWQPNHILILGKIITTKDMFATHHPKELVSSPQLKKEAHQILLSLKEKLHKGDD